MVEFLGLNNHMKLKDKPKPEKSLREKFLETAKKVEAEIATWPKWKQDLIEDWIQNQRED